MDRVKISIAPDEWGDLITKYDPQSKKLLISDFSDGTINVDTDVNGSLTKRKGGPNYNPTLLSDPTKDQYEAIFSDGARHLITVAGGTFKYSSGDTVFNSVVNGTGFSAGANFEFVTTQDRVYGGNRTNAPQVYDRVTNYGGVVYTAPRLKDMGLAAPSSAPSVAVVAGGAVPVGSHTYKVTYLYYDFEESNGGPASALATTTPGNQTVNLTSVPVGGYGVTARKIYRDDNDGVWLHVGTISNNTATTFSDTVAVGATPTPIPTDNNAPSSFGLITQWLDRVWIADIPGDPSILSYSESGLPDIFLSENQLLCNQEDPITALIVYFDRLVIFNRRSMGQVLGNTSDTFRYSKIPSSVGCVDTRTLQIRVIEGVPVLIWLSDRGFYTYDGNSINYISDPIEDLVNFNIQQAVQQRNANTQSSQAQFQSGTASDGIDLTTSPGDITTMNPNQRWDEKIEWEAAGTVRSNLVTINNSDKISAPTRATFDINQGQLSSSQIQRSGADIRTTPHTPFAGEENQNAGFGVFVTHDKLATRIIPTKSGFIIDAAVRNIFAPFPSPPSTVRVYSDSGGNPGVDLGQANTIHLNAGTAYWIVDLYPLNTNNLRRANVNLSGGASRYKNGAGAWTDPGHPIMAKYTFNDDGDSKSGQWTSTTYDTRGEASVPLELDWYANAPAPATLNVTVEGSNTLDLSGNLIPEVSQLISAGGFTGGNRVDALSLAGKRYWRIKLFLATSNDELPVLTHPNFLRFVNTATWESQPINTTGDSTVYNALDVVSNIPAGTTLTTQIRTATTLIGLGAATYVTFGSHTVRQYAQIRHTLVTSSDNQFTPDVLSTHFKWTIVANLQSSIIDTGVNPPAGWDIFLASFQTNGGTVLFEMRSAATSGAIPAATYFTVLPAEFPSLVTPNQFVQWRVTLTSTFNAVPVVESITVQWFISSVASIRPASIFVDGRYYVALAGLTELTNNILLELDLKAKWRRHDGLRISTFSFFFNRPYFGLATSGQIRKFLEGTTDAGVAIEFDVRTKAIDFSTNTLSNNSEKVKIVSDVILSGKNTGATIEMSYSLDLGVTFYPLYTNEGLTSYVTSSDGQLFFIRLRPNWDGTDPFAGRTVIYRIYSNDLNEVQINSLKVEALVRKQEPVITG